MREEQWILCPICGNKTRLKIREDTELKNFPLFCPKCKQEALINIRQLNMSVIKEPDAETITNELITHGCRLFSFQITASTMRLLTDCNRQKTVACRQERTRSE